MHYKEFRHRPFKETRSRPLRQKNITSSHHKKTESLPGNTWDRWLARLSFFAQILTPLLALAGFWYTVLPLYSKAILEEQVAKNQIELEKQQESLTSLLNVIEHKKQEVNSLTSRIEQEQGKSNSLRAEISALSIERLNARAAAEAANIEALKQYQSMRASVLLSALSKAALCQRDVGQWASFYSPMRKWTIDAEPSAKGERYSDLESVATCIEQTAIKSHGVGDLTQSDKKLFMAQLANVTRRLASEFATIDEKLAQARDSNIEEDKARESSGTAGELAGSLRSQRSTAERGDSTSLSSARSDRQLVRQFDLHKLANNFLTREIRGLNNYFVGIGWLPNEPHARSD